LGSEPESREWIESCAGINTDAIETEDLSPPTHFPNLGQSSVISSASNFTSPSPHFPDLGQLPDSSLAEGDTILEEQDDDDDMSVKFDCMFSGISPDWPQSPVRKRRCKV
jgi:hypothetical protein